jgi:hypothetical protein
MEEIVYEQNKSFRFDISISAGCYDHRPTDNDYERMSFFIGKVTVNELLELIK